MISVGVFISTLLWVVTVLVGGFAVYNLIQKNSKLEEIITKDRETLVNLRKVVEESDKLINKADKLGAFRNDDEVGYFFTLVKEIQATLNTYLND